MITLNIMKNPFKTDREIKQTSYIPGRSLLVYITPEVMGWKDYLVTHNGKVIAPEKYNEIVPASGDYIAICPVIEGDDAGKDIARAVALIAVSIASMGVGNLIAHATWAGTTAGWGWGSYVAAAATFHAGGALVNHLFPPPKQDVISNIATWSNLPPIAEEGGGIPITFGTVKMGVMAPIQVLNQKITNSGTKSHLNMLLCGGEEVDEIRDITINKQPVSNFPGVKTEVRLGTNDQTPIPGFADTWEEVPVGVELTEEGGWYYAQTKSDIGSGLELTFNFPMGLYYRNDKGKMMYEWIRLQPEYRKVGETDWKYWPSSITTSTFSATYVSPDSFQVSIAGLSVFRKNLKIFLKHGEGITEATVLGVSYSFRQSYMVVTVDTVVPSTLSLVEVRYIDIERKTNSPFSFTTRADDIGTGLVEVRCRIIKEGTDDKRANMTVWSTLTHITYDDFLRPGKSLVGIQALATDRLSGSLNVTWIQSRFNVWIWNPITERYEQRPANNPAWAAYDVIYRIKQVKNIHSKEEEDEIIVFSDVEEEYMDYQSFADWAAACDERGLKFNGVIHEVNDLWEALGPIEMAGRGKIIIRGTRYSVIHDSPASPTGMYAVSNIVKDSFRIEYIGKKDRANALEISFFNSDNDFEENTVICYGPDYDGSTTIAKPTQLRLPYAMSVKQACKEGEYQLRLNYYLNRAIYWGAGIDSLTGHAGEVVYVQHDVPEWGIGGRIAYVEGNDVFLDREVTMEPEQTNGLLVRLADDTLIEKALEPVEEATTTNIVTVTEPFELGKVPVTDDVFSFGLFKREAMPVRLVAVKRSGKLSAELMGLEYIKEIYEEAEEIPEIDYALEPAIFEVDDLSATEYSYMQKDGTIVSLIITSWQIPRGQIADEFLVYLSDDGGETWEYCGSTRGTEYTIPDAQTEETYLARVCVKKGFGITNGVVSNECTITGKDTPPSNVGGFTVIQQENVLKVTVIPPKDPDIARYEIRVGGLNWETSSYLSQFVDVKTTLDVTQAGTQTFWVKSIDNSGNYAEEAVSYITEIHAASNKYTIYEEQQNGRDWEPVCMFRDRNSWQIDSVEKIGDFEFFASIFECDHHLYEDAEITLNVVDLGDMVNGNYVETFLSVFWDFDASNKNYIDVEYRTSYDGETWGAWLPLVNHQFNGRCVQPKLLPRSVDGKTNVSIRGVTVRIDVRAVTETIDFLEVVAEGATRIILKHRFFNTPMPHLFSYASTGRQCTHEIVDNLITKDEDGRWYFNVRLWDGETQIAGRIGGSANGY